MKFLVFILFLLSYSCNNKQKKEVDVKAMKARNDSAFIERKLQEIHLDLSVDNKLHISVSNDPLLISSENKIFSYRLWKMNPFGLSKITVRYYVEKEGGYHILFTNDEPISPKFNELLTKLNVDELYERLGKGKYRMEFLSGDSILANAEFELQ